MAAIKFSKQSIQPNPMEVDYWVDITSNPYGGNIKYFNGYDWVDLLNAKGKPVNLDAYYNKLQMNQMLSEKASVESVNSKVDDTEVADVIKNIEFKDRGDEGVEMVVLKYDGMTVGVTLPTASNTTSGIITNKSFKDLVKQNQLQSVYSEMYDKLSEIRQQYQRKLKAGKNIQIDENNTIHAVGDISLDWEDVYNKPNFDQLFATVALAIQSESNRAKNAEQQLSARITDHVDVVEGKLELKADANNVYTKDQIDEKISGIYKIKGSRTFQDLPTSGNSIGDVYNITNNFALDGVEYPLGTNVVYTATGWDALAGIFDSTEIENKVDEIDTKVDEEVIRAKEKELELDKKFDDYLPLSGGTVKGAGYNILTVESSSVNAAIRLKGTSASHGGYLVYGGNSNWIFSDDGWKIDNIALHSNNYSNYALPLTGGKLTSDGVPLYVNRTSSEPKIGFLAKDKTIGYIGFDSDENLIYQGGLQYKIWHEGNDGEGSGLDADTLDGYHSGYFAKSLSDVGANNTKSNSLAYTYSTELHGGGTPGGLITAGMGTYGIQLNGAYSGSTLYFRGFSPDGYTDWKSVAFTNSNITGNAASASCVKLLDEITTDSFYNYIGDYAKGITAFSNKTDQTIGNIGLYDTVLNVGSTGDRFFRLLSKKNGDLRYQTPVNNANAWGPERTIIDSENVTQYTNHLYDLTGGAFIPRDADLNDYTTAGTYRCTYNDVAVTILNSPTTDAFVLYVYYPNGVANYCQKQEIVNWINYKRWTRRHLTSADEWSDWQLTLDNLNTYNAPTATKATQDSEGNVITDTYAIKDGYYKDMRVGLADDLGDMEEKIEEEYIIQPTANTNEIRDGYAHIDSLKGNSIVWNLLVSSDKMFVDSSNATTIVNKTDNSFIATSTAGNDEKAVIIGPIFKDNNIYLITFEYISNLLYELLHTNGSNIIEPASTFTRHVCIQKRSDSAHSRLYFYNYTTTTEEWNLEVKDLIIVDLTKMFGAGNEPTTLEEFEARRPKNVSNAYNEGEIINLTADSIKSVGFNQWDEEWEVGDISFAYGKDYVNPLWARNKGYIPVVPNNYYFIRKSDAIEANAYLYDEHKNYIKYIKHVDNRTIFVELAKFIRFAFYEPTYNNDICVNISNPDKNGTYEPYKEFVRQLPTNLFEGGMKSAGDTYDEIYWDKNKKKYIKVNRIGSIDLGSLDWERTVKAYVSSEYKFISTIDISNINGVPESLHTCSNYLHGYVNEEGTDKVLDIGNKINIVDNRYTDANTFKQAMQGVILHYELAEPIIEELDIPYMDYEVSNDGTERIESDTPTTPIKASVTYNFDAVNTIKLNRFDISDIKKKGATKLAKPVKLWGNDFDGSRDISDKLVLSNNSSISAKSSTNTEINLMYLSNSNNLIIGKGVNDTGFITAICGGAILFRSIPGSNEETMVIGASGNVGIGTADPQYKLDVNGLCRVKRSIIINHNEAFLTFDAAGHMLPVIQLNDNDNLRIGHGTANYSHNTYVSGNNLILTYGTSNTTGMILNKSGNVTIGSSDLASTHDKLYVDGKVTTRELYVSRNIVTGLGRDGLMISDNQVNVHDSLYNKVATVFDCDLNGNAYFKHTIGGGDLVDWYGVSWSEDSSDPTCTRIGNMALHRSLPILSAMKGYWISNKYASNGTPETFIPLNDSFTKLKYVGNTNEPYEISHLTNGGIFIKIPEFWYFDDYEPSTKTHNLKISQTAKAGWIRHKEAYVSAYEGCVIGNMYKAIKNTIPTVFQTREQLRTAVRENGYEDEYKWNIYTYEEHRAICHLFLVEYATRNSQAPVNTTLTSDGFKQGGLGSGCTTGSVKINGVDTYSFIPTGTTDSLGNGSGQVAYTVTLTDADGNEIGTVTRYVNRYRGIENPFGHIWKHVDDIVNVYNAGTTYKIVYKCNKPEHFATNKNAKYKPLCSFPGGSKMQGWAKEIKATINCDFFKYSVGDYESTYWCDYNYDSDDTSERCLLIGGCSGHGSGAGLFHFALSNGVGYSLVSIGSRLTYLPWAE